MKEMFSDPFKNVGKPAPELVPAGWIGVPVSLKAVRGNTVVLVFWNADVFGGFGLEDFIQSVLDDYNKFKTYRNVTFIGICCSMTATPVSMGRQVEQFKLRPFANMLDAGGATAKRFSVPGIAPNWLVIIDGEGNFAYNAMKGWRWSSGPNANKFLHHTELEKSLEKCPGILGLKDIPKAAEPAAHLYDLQQFNLLEAELKRLESKGGSEEIKAFTAHVRNKIAEGRKERREQIEALAIADPTQAYREALSFTAAFPGTPEKTVVQDLGKNLLRSPVVQKEIKAEEVYRRVLVPELQKRVSRGSNVKDRLKPLLDGYLKAYGDTEYAKAVVGAVEAYELSVSQSR